MYRIRIMQSICVEPVYTYCSFAYEFIVSVCNIKIFLYLQRGTNDVLHNYIPIISIYIPIFAQILIQ